MGIVICSSSLFALRMINYTLYPKALQTAFPGDQAKLMGLGRSQSATLPVFTSPVALATLPGGLMFLGLELIDSLNMYFVAPCLIA